MAMKHGIYPVVHTPLCKDESIDFKGLKASLDYYNQCDLPGVTVLGSGGELPYFSDSEQYSIIESAFHRLDRSKSLIAGVNAFSAVQAVEKIKSYSPYADYILLLLSDYYESSFDDYLRTLACIAEQSSKPILFYYFPQITKRIFTSKQLIAILSIDNIVGIKDSSVHVPTAKSILYQLPQTLYFSGLSLLLEPLMKIGAAGAICPVASLRPNESHDYYCAIQNNNEHIETIRNQLKCILPIVNKIELSDNLQYWALLLLSNSPIPLIKTVSSSQAKIKEALRKIGLPIQSTVRSPLPALSISDANRVSTIIDSL